MHDLACFAPGTGQRCRACLCERFDALMHLQSRASVKQRNGVMSTGYVCTPQRRRLLLCVRSRLPLSIASNALDNGRLQGQEASAATSHTFEKALAYKRHIPYSDVLAASRADHS